MAKLASDTRFLNDLVVNSEELLSSDDWRRVCSMVPQLCNSLLLL